jgi:hypothetical protein
MRPRLPRDSSVSIDVVTRAEIEASGATHVAEVLERRPGVLIEHTFAGAIASLEGLDPKYVLALRELRFVERFGVDPRGEAGCVRPGSRGAGHHRQGLGRRAGHGTCPVPTVVGVHALGQRRDVVRDFSRTHNAELVFVTGEHTRDDWEGISARATSRWSYSPIGGQPTLRGL